MMPANLGSPSRFRYLGSKPALPIIVVRPVKQQVDILRPEANQVGEATGAAENAGRGNAILNILLPR
jgi:hypothetical protein